MSRICKASNDWFDPDIVVITDTWGGYHGTFWENYDECHFPDGRVMRKDGRDKRSN